jgi:hypothetical protein
LLTDDATFSSILIFPFPSSPEDRISKHPSRRSSTVPVPLLHYPPTVPYTDQVHFVNTITMSFVRSVLQSKQIAARVVARSTPATSTQTSKFWTTAPVEQEVTQVKEAVKLTTQKEIIKAIAETHDLSLAESKRILVTVLDTITEVSIYTEPYRIASHRIVYLSLCRY